MPFDGTTTTQSNGYVSVTPRRKPFFARVMETIRSFFPSRSLLVEPTPENILRTAYVLIEQPDNWIQRRYETLDGQRCAVGAIRAASRMLGANPNQKKLAYNTLLSVAIRRGYGDIEKMNDHTSHSFVLRRFKEAINLVSVE